MEKEELEEKLNRSCFCRKTKKESREYSMKIKTINKMIAECDDESYVLFKKYINEELEDMGNSIEKHNFLNNIKVNLKNVKMIHLVIYFHY